MKIKYCVPLLVISLISFSCQQTSKSTSDSDDTTSVYQPSGDTTSSGTADSAVDKGMGDSVGVQGGSKVNSGTDTAGHH